VEQSGNDISTEGSTPSLALAPDQEGLIRLSADEWRARLTPEQFRITRKAGTERAFTGAYWDEHRPGEYHCVSCDLPLFDAGTKFESGTGWPSFWQPISVGAVEERADNSLFSRRTEILCSRCEAHLGHVFEDGPQPTGLRYCMNSAALRLKTTAE
jgi:peptide-methionine (R)-S-oxide reductase